MIDLQPWKLEFKPDWDIHFKHFDRSIQQHIIKKLEKMKQPIQGRGLNNSKYQIEETGQHRIAFIEDETTRTKYIHFIGNHKQYEKWYKQ